MRRRVFPNSQVAAFRLGRHGLADGHQTWLVEVCGDICGVQAQLMSAAEMALWARMPALNRGEIREALWTRRTLVKTHCMRQTLHLLPASDFALYVAALRSSRLAAVMRIMAKFGAGEAEARHTTEVIVEALAGGPLTPGELRRAMEPRVKPSVRAWMKRVWSPFRTAIHEGLICYGPNRGREVTFVRTDQWLPAQREVADVEAREILLGKYLRSYGPATAQDFARWAGVPMAQATTALAGLKHDLVEIETEDGRKWIRREDRKELQRAGHAEDTLRLLPAFDPYVLGHARKDHLIDAAWYKRVYRNQGWVSPVVLRAGRVVAVWSLKRGGKDLCVKVAPFKRLPKKLLSQLEKEAGSLGRFLEARCSLEVSP